MTENQREEIIKDMKDGYFNVYDGSTMDDLFEQIEREHKEVQQYRIIGTVEEFKKLKEKNTPKKPIHDGCYDSNGTFHVWNGINGVPYDLCPNCKTNLCTDGAFRRNQKKIKYCEECGQALNFEER